MFGNLVDSEDWLHVIFEHLTFAILTNLKVQLDHTLGQSIRVSGLLPVLGEALLAVRVGFVNEGLEVADFDGFTGTSTVEH